VAISARTHVLRSALAQTIMPLLSAPLAAAERNSKSPSNRRCWADGAFAAPHGQRRRGSVSIESQALFPWATRPADPAAHAWPGGLTGGRRRVPLLVFLCVDGYSPLMDLSRALLSGDGIVRDGPTSDRPVSDPRGEPFFHGNETITPAPRFLLVPWRREFQRPADANYTMPISWYPLSPVETSHPNDFFLRQMPPTGSTGLPKEVPARFSLFVQHCASWHSVESPSARRTWRRS